MAILKLEKCFACLEDVVQRTMNRDFFNCKLDFADHASRDILSYDNVRNLVFAIMVHIHNSKLTPPPIHRLSY